MQTIFFAHLFAYALLVALGIPLLRRRIRPNGLYGLRTHATLADAGVWYEANAQSGRDLVVIGVAGLGLTVGLYLPSGVSEAAYSWIVSGFAVVALLVSWYRGTRYSKELLKQQQD